MKEFLKSLKQLGFQIAHFQWEINKVPELPYLIWITEGKDTTFADDENFFDFVNFRLELYTDAKDTNLLENQQKVSDFLKQQKLAFSFEEVAITDEKMIMTIYEFQLRGE